MWAMKQSISVRYHVYSPSQSKVKALNVVFLEQRYLWLCFHLCFLQSYPWPHYCLWPSQCQYIHIFSLFHRVKFWRNTGLNNVHTFHFSRRCQSLSYAQHDDSPRGNYNLLHIFLMYFTTPLFPEYLRAPIVWRTRLERLLYRLGGKKMTSLIKRKRISENLSPISHIIIWYRLSVTTIKCKIVEAKCTHCTQYNCIIIKTILKMSQLKNFTDSKILSNLNFLGYEVPEYIRVCCC